jgi:integrase
MSLFKRGKNWWTDFSVNGVRYRLSLDTTDWREAQSREKEKIAQASTGKLTPVNQQFARLGFSTAAARYLDGRKLEVLPRTIDKERDLLRAPAEYLRDTPLRRLTLESLMAYRQKRAADGKAALYINMEMGAVRRVLKKAKRWHLFADDLKPLKKDGRGHRAQALSESEKLRLLRTTTARPDWQVARLAMTLALNTTMRGCEIRGLCWDDIDFIERTVRIRKSKTPAGERLIPLNADAWAAILEARNHCFKIFGRDPAPEWYVFPHEYERNGSWRPDPARPVKSWRTAWRSITRAAGLQGFRFHDLRHQAITELAESQDSDQTIMAIAGHVSRKMLEHYSHIRLEAKRRALEALSGRVDERVTSQTTTQMTQSELTRFPN